MPKVFDSKLLKLAIIVAFGLALLLMFVAGYSRARNASKTWAEKERQWLKGEGAFFVRKGCIRCHSISSLDINAAKIGPDLSDAVVDVERRFGKTLEEFLNNPTGTMSVVLMTRIPLTDEEKREAIETLKIAYQRKLERQAQAQK
jgi:cytochrome c2